MFKHHHPQWAWHPTFQAAQQAVASGLLMALAATSTGAVSAQPRLASHADHQATTDAPTAQAETPLTLHQAIALALDGNFDLQAARREVEATQGHILQGQARPNPELVYALEDQRTATRTHSVQINLPIEMGGKRSARIAVAERERDKATQALNVRRAEIRAGVMAAFVATLVAQERAALAQSSMDLAQKASDAAAKRVAAGKISPIEATKARIAEAGVRVELAQAHSEQRSARLHLASLLGASAPRFTHVAGGMPALAGVPSIEVLEERLLASPALRQAQLEVELRRSLVDVERSKQSPDITLSVGVKRSNELRRDQLLVGLSVPLPLFDRNEGNLLQALKREDQAQDALQALRARTSAQVLQARERLESSQGEVDALQRDVVPAAKSTYHAATLGFEHGKFSFLEVLDAQRTYFAAQSQYLQALAQVHRAAADIDQLLGESSEPSPYGNKE